MIPSPSSQSAQTIQAQTRAQRWGRIVKRHAASVIAFMTATGWTITQLMEGWSSFREWKNREGLWPVIALIALGVILVAGGRVVQLLTALTARDAVHDEAIGSLREAQAATHKEVAELREQVGRWTGEQRRI